MSRVELQAILAVKDRPKCLLCAKPLPLFKWRNKQSYADMGRLYGDYGDNLFCNLRHAALFARLAAPLVFPDQFDERGTRKFDAPWPPAKLVELATKLP